MKSVPSGRPLAIVVVGASGDLATRKIFPAIFALDARGGLPPDTHCFGFARSDLSDEAFRNRIAPGLRCEELADSACELHQNSFLPRCHYVQGAYDAAGDFARLRRGIATVCGPAVDVLYYFAIPPALFGPVAHSMRAAGILRAADDATGWDRVVLEKPFGHDRASSDALSAQLKECFREEQIYRIDHYLGKEVIQNLLVLRFANSAFEPLWNRDHVRQVHICWSEDIPLAGRAGYFDEAGIIRDVMQNHLTQMLALVAMECPWGLDARHIRDEKVRLLRQVVPLTRDRCLLGQYTAGTLNGKAVAGYREEPGVPAGSRTATSACAVFEVRSPRWRGVPFLVSATKGAATRCTEIRMRLKSPENDLFRPLMERSGDDDHPLLDNELVIHVQPDAKIFLRIVGKRPGIGFKLDNPLLDLIYREAYAGARIGDAYENLLLDVIRGDGSLFIRDDELEAAWGLFTPLLHELEAGDDVPLPYPFGTPGPKERLEFAGKFGIGFGIEGV